MNKLEAMAKMVPPSQKRKGKPRGGVIQILVTSNCDLGCYSCTQSSQLQRKSWYMTPEQFEQAVISLSSYDGICGCFGGNPCISKYFNDYCRILQKHIPKERCGLWSNNLMGKGKICRETFNPAISNLNVHLARSAYEEMLRDWPECRPFGLVQDSRHSPILVAMKDVIDDENERWDLISKCSINQHWSAGIGVFRGELRSWFCEIAMSQSILYQDDLDYPDTGLNPNYIYYKTEGSREVECKWWELGMDSFDEQVEKHCHNCSVPMNLYGQLSQTDELLGKEQVSATHHDIFKPKRKNRRVELVMVRNQLEEGRIARTIDYLQNSNK